MKKKANTCSRREFMEKAAVLGLAGAASVPVMCHPGGDTDNPVQKPPSPPAQARRSRVVRFRQRRRPEDAAKIDEGAASKILQETLSLLTGKKSLAGSLGMIFKPGERVGIKLNCLAGRGLSPQPALVNALVGGLAGAGIKRTDIVVFERSERELREAGFSIQRDKGPRIIGNDSPGMGYESRPFLHKSIGSCFSRILTREVDAFINFGVLKDHNLAGVSAGLKNLFGLIHNPNKYHDDHCNPFVAHVADSQPVKEKLRLTLCDAMTAQYNGGPALVKKYTWHPGLFLASQDPVALDAVAAALIEEKRRSKGLPSLEEDGRPPLYIKTASDCGLGEADPSKIDIIDNEGE